MEILDRRLKPPWFKAEIFSKGSVPAIQYGKDFLLGDSIAVVNWLDEHREQIGAKPGSLIPPNEHNKQFEQIMEQLSPRLIFNLYGLMFNHDLQKDNLLGWKVRLGMQWIEKILASKPGPFFLGDQISLFEIVLAPFIDRFRACLPKYRGFNLLGAELVALTRWMAAVDDLPAYQFIKRSGEYYNTVWLVSLPERVVQMTDEPPADIAAEDAAQPDCIA